MKVDLHIHTTASDGRLSPSEVVHRAADMGLKAIAITDHDSIEGVEEALAEARKFPKMLVIPGIEMGADVPREEMHILGYFVDPYSRAFCQKLEMLRSSRAARGEKMVFKLAEMGIKLNWEHVVTIAAGASVGRPHIAQAILERGYISNLQEAFDHYIGEGSPAYVKREKLSPVETVELIDTTGGLPVLAHPAGMDNLERKLEELKPAGLLGLEVFYKDYKRETIDHLAQIAREHGLVSTGGSDYHGFEDTGNEIGGCDVPWETVEYLITLRKQRGGRGGS